MINIMSKKNGCSDGCSFYRMSYKLETLSNEKQIEVEKAIREGDLSLEQNYDLLFNTQTKTCLGGLITDGNLRQRCAYFSEHPEQCSEGDLLQYFIALKSTRQSIPWKAATLILTLLSFILSILVFNSPSEKDRDTLIEKQKVSIRNINNENTILKNKIKNLIIKNIDLKENNDMLLTNENH